MKIHHACMGIFSYILVVLLKVACQFNSTAGSNSRRRANVK
mgnify:CR=1 FL=1